MNISLNENLFFGFKKIELDPIGGADLYSCLKEAVHIALNANCEVVFMFNGKEYITEPKLLFETIKAKQK
jgi:hypothetical protein